MNDNVSVATVSPKKVLTLGFVPYGTGRVQPFDTIFPQARQVRPTDILEGKVDALVIWGGEDISPSLYNEPVHPATGATEELSHRDEVEKAVCDAAITRGIPIIGICRGAQLLCALAGGKLYQDVSGHHGRHEVVTKDGESYITSSIHHQMMDTRQMPESDYELIAWTPKTIAKEVGDGVEPEIVHFPKIKALAIQGHPEFMSPDDDFVNYTRRLIKEYLL